jgi:adenylylsulfate kinase-like enzyme
VRQEIRKEIGSFIEVYVKCSIEELSRRDVKGLYKKALAGEIDQFTGISDPYEEPLNPEIIVHSDKETIQQSVEKIMNTLYELKHLSQDEIHRWKVNSAPRSQ